MPTRALFPLLLVTGLLAVGCGGPAAPPPPTPTPSPEVSGAVTEVVPPNLATGVIPGTLERIDDDSEQLFDAVPAHDWARVRELVAGAEEAWGRWKNSPDAKEVPEDLQDAIALKLRDLRDAAGGEHEASILRAANNLEMVVLDVVEIYHPALPTAVGRLDVAERDLLLDIAADDRLAASETLAGAASLWEDLQDQVHGAGGGQVAADFDAVLARQQKALGDGDMATLLRETEAAERIIDRIEALFS